MFQTQIRHCAAVMIVVLAATLSCATDQEYSRVQPEGFEEAAREARKNHKTIRGRRYQRDISNTVKSGFEDALRSCKLKQPDYRRVKFLLKMGEDGKPIESIHYPDGAFSTCYLERLLGFDYPPPPTPDYWLGFLIPAPRSWAPGR